MDAIKLAPETALPLRFANRHTLVAGITGAGKSCALQALVEGFSAAGVPAIVFDVKGDLSGIATSFPTRFWCPFAADGFPLKTSAHEFGSQLLARLLGLNAVQEGVLNIAFRVCHDPEFPASFGCRLMDMADVRASVADLLDWREDLRQSRGNVTSATVGAIQRALLSLEAQGGEAMFGEPALDITDMLQCHDDGRGIVSLIAADRLADLPSMFSALGAFLLTRLLAVLPEAGDLAKPKLALVIDEAHLLFSRAPTVIIDLFERLIRIARSKGIAIVLSSQHPHDIPAAIGVQIGNRIQFALRGFTAAEQRTVKAAADSLRPNPAFDASEIISQLAVGEALVSFLCDGGAPSMVERVKLDLPTAQIGPIDYAMRRDIVCDDSLAYKYGVRLTREEEHAVFIARVMDSERKTGVEEEQQEPQPSHVTAVEPPAPASWWQRLVRSPAARGAA